MVTMLVYLNIISAGIIWYYSRELYKKIFVKQEQQEQRVITSETHIQESPGLFTQIQDSRTPDPDRRTPDPDRQPVLRKRFTNGGYKRKQKNITAKKIKHKTRKLNSRHSKGRNSKGRKSKRRHYNQ
jgi:hypothetical protein